MRLCNVEGCGEGSQFRGWCGTHYQRWLNTGTVELAPDPGIAATAHVRQCGFLACVTAEVSGKPCVVVGGW